MSLELLETAEFLLSRQGGPTPSDACRAASTVYYSLFHFLAKQCCDLFVGTQNKTPPQRAWQHLYRSLNHSVIEARCRKIPKMAGKGFPVAMTEFSGFMRSMLWKRERLDYSFSETPQLDLIRNDIALAKDFLIMFANEGELHKRAYSVYILFGEDRHEKKRIEV